jgi:hypothetical protein
MIYSFSRVALATALLLSSPSFAERRDGGGHQGGQSSERGGRDHDRGRGRDHDHGHHHDNPTKDPAPEPTPSPSPSPAPGPASTSADPDTRRPATRDDACQWPFWQQTFFCSVRR